MKILFKFILFSISLQKGVSAVKTWNINLPDPIKDPIHSINNVMVNMLTKCYSDHKEVVIHSESNKLTMKSIEETEYFSMIILHDPPINDFPQLRLHKNLFVTTPHSRSHLSKMLISFKNSRHWNIKAPLFILNQSKNQCKDAENMLKAAWEMNIINSFFFCIKNRQKVNIYTYNPYTDRAPQPWQKIRTAKGQSTRWTSYVREFRIENICDGLNFDRTQHLDGSVIRIASEAFKDEGLIPSYDYDESIIPRLYDDTAMIVRKMKHFFNATLIFNIDKAKQLQGYANNETCDVAIVKMVDFGFHPVRHLSYHIVVNKRGFRSFWEMFEDRFNVITLVLTGIILLLTFIVIAIFQRKKDLVLAGIEVMRLLVNKSLHTRMDRAALKIFFSSVLLYFLLMQATLLSHLSAFYTKQELRVNAETMEDLKDPRYTAIFVPWTIEQYIEDPILRKKLVLDNSDCAHRIIGNHTAVCIIRNGEFLSPKLGQLLHVSKKPVFELQLFYEFREDWPLQDRFQKFLIRLEGTGHSIDSFLKIRNTQDLDQEKRRSAISDVPFHPISLSVLDWAFILLLIGQKIAMIYWISERYKRNTNRIRNNSPKRGRGKCATENVNRIRVEAN